MRQESAPAEVTDDWTMPSLRMRASLLNLRPARTRMHRIRRRLVLASQLLFALSGTGIALKSISPVRFRADTLAVRDCMRRHEPLSNLCYLITSGYSVFITKLRSTPPIRPADPDNPESVFSFIAQWLPTRIRVHPTEEFLYFDFTAEGRKFRGNLRLADLDDNRLSISCFELQGEARTAQLEPGKHFTVAGISDREYCVTIGGHEVIFERPRLSTKKISANKLTTREEWVGSVYDESGERFHLIFHHRPHAFYYVLDENEHEPLTSLAPNLLRGQRTGFVYVRQQSPGLEDRLLLVGTPFQDGIENTYCDGPADQVPIGLDLRERLHLAYPSTMWGKGIASNGVLLGREQWARYAIVSFQLIQSDSDAIEMWAESPLEHAKAYSITREWWKTDRWWSDATTRAANEIGRLTECSVCGQFGNLSHFESND